MAVQTQVIRFSKSTGANGTTQDVNLNFTPKAIRLISDGGTADNTVSAQFQYIEGFSDGTNHACISCGSVDNAAASVTGRIIRDDSVFVRLSESLPNTTTVCTGTCVFATNKVTFTWVLNDAVATRIIMWAVGGDDITNVKVNTVDAGTTTPATVDYTGLGFTPVESNAVVFLLANTLATTNSNSTGCVISSGCGVSSTKRWVVLVQSEHGADPSDTWRFHSASNSLMTVTSAGAQESLADFNGWVTNGFQLDWVDAPSASTQKLSYMVINGGTWDASTLSSPASGTSNSDTSVSVNSNTLRGIMLATVSLDVTALDTISTINNISVGFSDSTPSQATIGMIDEDAQTTMDSYRVNNTANILRNLTTNGADLTVATFDSFPTTSSFRIDYGTTTANHQISWLVVADFPITTQPHSYGKIHTMFDNNIGSAIFG